MFGYLVLSDPVKVDKHSSTAALVYFILPENNPNMFSWELNGYEFVNPT